MIPWPSNKTSIQHLGDLSPGKRANFSLSNKVDLCIQRASIGIDSEDVKARSLLLECSQQWFIITGRRPLPVVAAVIALVAEANQVKLNLDDVVREVYSHPRTSRMRLTELKEALVGVGQKLPWGKDITVKTLDKHLPFLVKFLEADMKRAKKKSGSVSQLPLSKGVEHTKESY